MINAGQKIGISFFYSRNISSLKILRIKKSSEFQKISSSGYKFFSKTITLLSKQTPQNYFQDLTKNQNAQNFCRVGYTVSKTVGGAVVRNFAKRRLREAFRNLGILHAKNHYDYVVIARKEIANADFNKIVGDLKFCLKRIHNQPNKTEKS